MPYEISSLFFKLTRPHLAYFLLYDSMPPTLMISVKGKGIPMPIEEKRQFARVSLAAKATLFQEDLFWLGHVVDISFKGVLINSQTPFSLDENQAIMAEIFFKNDTSIKIKVEKAHNNGPFYGFYFLDFDDGKMMHLRTIIMDNLDNESLCDLGSLGYKLGSGA